jgi:hypothetical protein
MAVAKNVACYDTATITAAKCFIVQSPRVGNNITSYDLPMVIFLVGCLIMK